MRCDKETSLIKNVLLPCLSIISILQVSFFPHMEGKLLRIVSLFVLLLFSIIVSIITAVAMIMMSYSAANRRCGGITEELDFTNENTGGEIGANATPERA